MALHGVARQIAFIEFLRNSRRPIEFPLRWNSGDRPSIAMGTRDSHDVRKRDASVSRARTSVNGSGRVVARERANEH